MKWLQCMLKFVDYESAFKNNIFGVRKFSVSKFFSMNSVLKNGCKNGLQDSIETFCSWSRNRALRFISGVKEFFLNNNYFFAIGIHSQTLPKFRGYLPKQKFWKFYQHLEDIFLIKILKSKFQKSQNENGYFHRERLTLKLFMSQSI